MLPISASTYFSFMDVLVEKTGDDETPLDIKYVITLSISQPTFQNVFISCLKTENRELEASYAFTLHLK